ncbi:MAG: MFS transporter [Chloroflexota bacterium]
MMRRLLAAILRMLYDYRDKIRSFQPNARLYLLNVALIGAAMGVYRLLFNFYVLSLGYDEALLGRLVTVSSLTALLAALPMGYLADQIGRKGSLILSGALTCLSILVMVQFPGVTVFYLANLLLGVAQSLGGVTTGPFLMENSSDHERTYLFSINSGLQMVSASVGNWIGGSLPGWLAGALAASATSAAAYGAALALVALAGFASLLPLGFIRSPRLARSQRSVFAPLSYARRRPGELSRLILPMLITSIGAGLIMPFMNVFFRQVHHQPDPTIGAMFAWGSLAMGVGLLAAPPLADRMGKIQLVVVSQALSIPFLVLLGFAPLFWISAAAYYVRLALMNMSGPIYQTFVMEHAEQESRATVASLVSMSWNFGWAFSPMISGWLQVRYGFGPAFLGTIVLYTLSTVMYYVYFWRPARADLSARPNQVS